MMDNTISETISNEPLETAALNFSFLRERGIEQIQKLAGQTWTDHNIHDPGITILDQLCYAITDLSYRINFEMKDLIADGTGNAYKNLYSPAEILTVNPVTILDLRKVVLDVEGVKNAWVEKLQSAPQMFYKPKDNTLNLLNEDGNAEPVIIAGLYRVLIEQSDETALDGKTIVDEVKSKLNGCRNVCEDFAEVKILPVQNVFVSGKIEVGHVDDVNSFAADVLFKMARFVSPKLKFYTLQQLLNKGKAIDEIFEGPVLSRGFTDDDELRSYERKSELHVSDIIREIMDVPGVKAVKSIALATDPASPQKWRLVVDREKTPNIVVESIFSNLIFVKNELEISLDFTKIKSLFYERLHSDPNLVLNEKDRNIIPVTGTLRNISSYYSIQNHFQQVYGIGQMGLPETASELRKAQAKQLKAYLMFFEQILANYFAQTAHIKDLFSFDNSVVRTYFHQSLAGSVPGAEEILLSDNGKSADENLADISEDETDALSRKNRFLNHLLARFSESFTDYSMLLYELMQNDPLAPMEKLMNDKLNFLKNYPGISSGRGRAFNYTLNSWDSDNISGLEKRIALKIGVNNYNRRSLAAIDEEGFHMVEHILLRPVDEDSNRFTEYIVRKNIDVFEKSDRNGWVRCTSVKHGLQSGEEIQIRGSNGYNGIFVADRVAPDSFEILFAYTEPGNDLKISNEFGEKIPSWIRTHIDTNFLTLSQPVIKFSDSGSRNNIFYTLCQAAETGLEAGERIEITGTKNYNGAYSIANVTEQSFEIPAKFMEAETTGRWISDNQQKDPYSLQLTFVFPNWPARFQINTFRQFIENTIREETPVHLTVYIQWLGKDEMSVFENAYKNFLQKLIPLSNGSI